MVTMTNTRRRIQGGQQTFSNLSLCVVVSVVSLLIYNSVRSYRSLKYVEQRRVVEGIVPATRSSSSSSNSDFDTTLSSAWSHLSTTLTSSRTLQLNTTSSSSGGTTEPDPMNSGSLLVPSKEQVKNAPLLRPDPLPSTTQQLPVHPNATTFLSPTTHKEQQQQKQQQPQPLCSRQQIQSGQWVPVTLDKPPYVTKTKHLRCYPAEHYSSKLNDSYPSWDWQVLVPGVDVGVDVDQHVQQCRLVPWELSNFCKLLDSATVSIIGDSLSWEQYSSLLQLAGARVHQKDQHRSKSDKKNHVQYACRGSERSSGGETTGTKFVFRNDPRLTQITDSIQHDFPVVLILNRGAHYVNDTELLSDMRQTIVPAVQAWWGECQRHNLKCHLFWRTTVPGHVGCDQIKSEHDDGNDINNNNNNNSSSSTVVKLQTNVTVHNTHLHRFSHPVNDLAYMEARLYNQSLYTEQQWQKFHWQDFPRQNRLVLEELSRSMSSLVPSNTVPNAYATSSSLTPLSVTIIDAYELNMLRPDEHRAHQTDCLHNCYPGKMDVYNQLLLHHLTVQRTAQDVQQLQELQQRARARARSDKFGAYSRT